MTMEVDGDKSAELEADLRELRAMLELSKRPSVQQELQRVYTKLEQELKGVKARPTAEASVASPAEAAPKAAAAPSSPVIVGDAEAGYPPVQQDKKAAAAAAPPPQPVRVDVRAAGPWTEITTFALDLGGYDKPHVSVDVRLKGIETFPKENVTWVFPESSFDLKILGLEGKNYRFLKTNLDKDISPADSEVKVKKNHIILQLAKVKGQYGYDTWMDLCAKGGKRKPTPSAGKDADPQASIMSMMQDLYEDGDDNMKKIIGEAMYKAKRGEKYDPQDLPKSEMDM